MVVSGMVNTHYEHGFSFRVHVTTRWCRPRDSVRLDCSRVVVLWWMSIPRTTWGVRSLGLTTVSLVSGGRVIFWTAAVTHVPSCLSSQSSKGDASPSKATRPLWPYFQAKLLLHRLAIEGEMAKCPVRGTQTQLKERVEAWGVLDVNIKVNIV